MHINPKEDFAGVKLIQVRSLLKKIGWWQQEDALVQHFLKATEATSKAVLKKLITDGYIEKVKPDWSETPFWETTKKGSALVKAPASLPLTRKTADLKIKQLMERVCEVNTSDFYLYKVTSLVLFGSYLSDKERIGDIDLAVEVHAKYSAEKQEQLEKKKIEDARKVRSFSYWLEEMAWPSREVILFLKSRSTALRIGEAPPEIWQSGPHQILFPASKE